MGSESKYYQEVLKKLEGFIRKEYLQLIIFGMQVFISIILLGFTFFALIELIGNFASIVRTVLFVVLTLGFFSLTFFFVLKPLFWLFKNISSKQYFDAAAKVGKDFPDVNDELINTMQLVTENENSNLYSPVLIDAAFKRVYENRSLYK